MNCREYKQIVKQWGRDYCKLSELLDVDATDIYHYECGTLPIPNDIAEKIKSLPPPPKKYQEQLDIPERGADAGSFCWSSFWGSFWAVIQFICFIVFFIPLAIVYVGCLFCGSGSRR